MQLAVNHLIDKYGEEYPLGSEFLEQLSSFDTQAIRLVDNTSDVNYAKDLNRKFTAF